MDTCVRCGADLGVGRFCLNCGHPIGEPVPIAQQPVAPPAAAPPAPTPDAGPATAAPEPVTLPVQAADPTAVAPVSAPVTAAVVAPEPAPEPEVDPTPEPELDPTLEPEPVLVRTSRWDPREELLPYEEVDELDVDDPVPGRAWLYWVLGAVLLVGLVFVLLEAFGTDGDETTATDTSTTETSAPASEGQEETTEPEEEPAAPTGVGRRIDLAATATFDVPGTAPPTRDFDGNLVAYEPAQMHDGDPSTTWRIAGDATGQAVTITLAEPAVVSRVGLVNGYAKQVAGVDWYPNNRRILAVTWSFDDGTTAEQTFAEQPRMQLLKVPPVQTSTLSITITSVTPPGSGNLGRDYTAISEVAITGRRAG